MPKRPRYEYVTIVADYVSVYANGSEYRLPRINSWQTFEAPSTINPEEMLQYLAIDAPDGKFIIRCKDEDETYSIIEELIDQGF